MSVLHNFPLWAALTAIILAQVVKIPIYLITKRTLKLGLGFSTGGMPSSHSAGVTSLATAVGITEGLDSSLFAIASLVSIITMYDAAGIRRHAGMHATFLNRIIKKMPHLRHEGGEQPEDLKELLGHRPIEVVAGAFFGIAVGILLYVCLYV